MSDMNRQAQLRQGLTQYVGAMLTNLSLEPRDASQVTAASLVEAELSKPIAPARIMIGAILLTNIASTC